MLAKAAGRPGPKCPTVLVKPDAKAIMHHHQRTNQGIAAMAEVPVKSWCKKGQDAGTAAVQKPWANLGGVDSCDMTQRRKCMMRVSATCMQDSNEETHDARECKSG